ncbi:MAG: YciI-like protein [Ginsengibacter sp.]
MNNNYYILFYNTVDDYTERRKAFREEHLKLAQDAFKNGTLIMGGALANPADSAILIFKGENPSVAEAFAKNDPYVKNGLVTEWHVRLWTVVIGNE